MEEQDIQTVPPREWSNRQISVLIFMAGLLLFSVGLSVYSFTGASIIYGKMMLKQQSFSNLFPVVSGNDFTAVPVTYAMLMQWTKPLFAGKVNMFTASLPSSLFSAFSLVFIYLIGSRKGRHPGFMGVALTVASYYFICVGRTPSPESFVVFATLGGFYAASSPKCAASWRWPLMILLPLAGFAFYGPLGLLIPAVAVSSQLKGVQSIVYNICNLVAVVILTGLVWTLYPVKDGDPMPLLNHHYELRLIIAVLIPVASLITGNLLLNYNHHAGIEKLKKIFFKLIPFLPFALAGAIGIQVALISTDNNNAPRLPIMVPTIILLVCGMGMIALPKEIKKSTRETIMIGVLAISIFAFKIMGVDPAIQAKYRLTNLQDTSTPRMELKK